MTAIDPIISLLVQVPLVGIFVWFTLQLSKNMQKQQDERDAQWRDFLREQRESNNAALGRLADEIKSNTQVLTAHMATIRREKS